MEEKQGQNEKRLQCTVVRDLEPHKAGDDGGVGKEGLTGQMSGHRVPAAHVSPTLFLMEETSKSLKI